MAPKKNRPADPPLEPEQEPLAAEVHTLPGKGRNGAIVPHPGNQFSKGIRKGKRGRPPSIVRQSSRMGYYTRIPFLKRVADGTEYRIVNLVEQVQKLNPTTGKMEMTAVTVEVKVYPTINERLKAVDLLGKYGGLITVRMEEDEDDGDDEPNLAGFDFGKLSNEQLEVLHNLLQLAKPKELNPGE